ncbi:hypothetical protein [Zobellella sp. An-6]|uniref:hypothetical protein n=1 Tax=Zobellella sp. An-6 TaxID=3400218 RepID=UPI004042768B
MLPVRPRHPAPVGAVLPRPVRPLFVYVKEGRIQRVTPLEPDDKDAPSWELQVRGK